MEPDTFRIHFKFKKAGNRTGKTGNKSFRREHLPHNQAIIGHDNILVAPFGCGLYDLWLYRQTCDKEETLKKLTFCELLLYFRHVHKSRFLVPNPFFIWKLNTGTQFMLYLDKRCRSVSARAGLRAGNPWKETPGTLPFNTSSQPSLALWKRFLD